MERYRCVCCSSTFVVTLSRSSQPIRPGGKPAVGWGEGEDW